MRMNAHSYLFTRLTAEDSAVVCGGSGSYPTFVYDEPTKEGTILNADGNGNSVSFAVSNLEISEGDSRNKTSDPYLNLGLGTSV